MCGGLSVVGLTFSPLASSWVLAKDEPPGPIPAAATAFFCLFFRFRSDAAVPRGNPLGRTGSCHLAPHEIRLSEVLLYLYKYFLSLTFSLGIMLCYATRVCQFPFRFPRSELELNPECSEHKKTTCRYILLTSVFRENI